MKQFLMGVGVSVLIIAVAAMVYLRIQAKNILPIPQESRSPRPAISDSGRDWLENVTGTSEGVLTRMLITTTVAGRITDINRKEGKFPIEGSYYTGEPGFYTYAGQLKLINPTVMADLGKHFICAKDVRTKKTVGKDYALKHLDIIEIVAGK